MAFVCWQSEKKARPVPFGVRQRPEIHEQHDYGLDSVGKRTHNAALYSFQAKEKALGHQGCDAGSLPSGSLPNRVVQEQVDRYRPRG